MSQATLSPSSTRRVDRLWMLYEQHAITEANLVLGFLDVVDELDVEDFVASLAHQFRAVLHRVLKSRPIAEIPGGFVVGLAIAPEYRRTWQVYRQRKAELVLRALVAADLR
jgi:hypothetical protein